LARKEKGCIHAHQAHSVPFIKLFLSGGKIRSGVFGNAPSNFIHGLDCGGVLSSPVDDQTWEEASLPTSMGGEGLRQAVPHSSAAYLASIAECYALIHSFDPDLPPDNPIDESMAGSNPDCLPPLTLFKSFLSHVSSSELQDLSLPSFEKLHQKHLSFLIDRGIQLSVHERVEASENAREKLAFALSPILIPLTFLMLSLLILLG